MLAAYRARRCMCSAPAQAAPLLRPTGRPGHARIDSACLEKTDKGGGAARDLRAAWLRCARAASKAHTAPAASPLQHPAIPRRLEDLEVALDAAARVNRHLNAEAQALVSELRRAQRERDAWQRHAQHLARCLAAERRRRAGEGVRLCVFVRLGGGALRPVRAWAPAGVGPPSVGVAF